MSAVINNDYQTALLFKQFTGVAATQLNAQFSNEPFRAIVNIFSRDVFIEDIPDQAPIGIYNLDNSSNWADSDLSGNPSDIGGGTFATLYPDSKLQFYKNVALDPVPGSQNRVWRKLDSNGNNILRDCINFKYDDVNSTYLMRVKYSTNGTTYINNSINSWPLFWVMDNQSGYLQFYSTTADLLSNASIPTNKPKISFFKYIGKKGITNLDVSGQQQVADLSGIDTMLNGINRMILPDGYVDISGGAPYDLCGNEVVRTHYQYTRNHAFIGYPNLPILDGSAVDHSFDPSHNIQGISNELFHLDVSGDCYVSQKIVVGVSGGFYIESNSGDTHIIGASEEGDMEFSSSNHVSIHVPQQQNAFYVASSGSVGVGTAAPSAKLEVNGNTLMGGELDMSCNNIVDVSRISFCTGGLLDLSCNPIVDVSSISFCNGSSVTNASIYWGEETTGIYSPTDDTIGITCLGHKLATFTCSPSFLPWPRIEFFRDLSMNGAQIKLIGHATDNSGVPSWGQVKTAITDLSNSIVSSYWDLSGSNVYYNTGNVGIGTSSPSEALEVSGNIVLWGDLSMNGGQITFIGDATDNSGVPSWGQVQQAINDGSGGSGGSTHWDLSGTNIYSNNSGNVGIGTANPTVKLDVSGSVNITENAFVSMSATQSIISADKNLYTRNTNLIDTLKIGFETFYNKIWIPMIIANENRTYTNPITGVTQTLSIPNPGKSNAVPTFSSAWGPCVIPIAYLDINQNYVPTPFEPQGAQTFQTAFRPDIANTTAYFTIKFSEPYDAPNSAALGVDWKVATLYKQHNGSMKSGVAAITEQTITFMVGYIDSYQLSAPNGGSADVRNPKPFIKIISTNIGNLKCLTGITVKPNPLDPSNPIDPADIDDLTQNMKYYGFTIDTPKIGGICRIIIAESCPGIPANKEIQNKAWLLLEQQWNVEPWQIQAGVNNSPIIEALVGKHIINVRMYSNNLGDLNSSRNPPFTNEYNTDWQLVTEKQIQDTGIYSWEKFVLPMGNYAVPQVFNPPTSPPVSDISFTLMVGGTHCPNPITGNLDNSYPTIVNGANLWEVWLNLKNWPYGITTTEEVFENNVDICGNLVISGSTFAQAITATDITCNNLDALNSIDVGPSQQLTITENKIISTTAASNPTSGLEIEANNMYMNFAAWSSAGGSTPSGLYVKLGDSTSNTQAQIRDFAGVKLFMVEGSGLMQTQQIWPFSNMTYDIGYKGNNPNQDLRYKNLYIGNIDASGDINVTGSYGDISATNIDVSNDINVAGSYGDISATNIDVSNDLNVEGLITGVGDTTFVEYRNFSNDISAVTFDGGASNGPSWYCIATCEGTQDNARGLFIIDDDTSGIREQIIFYAGTSYARGNYINVIAHNWYLNNGPLTTDMKIDVSGNQPTPSSPAIYAGANLYIYRAKSFSVPDVHVRLYQNGRAVNSGGRWVLTHTPIVNLNTTAVELDITYDPNDKRANAISSLDTVFYGDVSFNGDVNINNFNLVGQLETTSDSPVSITPGSPPYVWGTNYIQQVNPSDPYLLGSYKQIRSALFIWSGDEGITYSPPNNVPQSSPSGSPVINPPCQGGGELLKLETPTIWDLPSANYNATNHTFSIPNLASRTMMTVELSIDIFYNNVNNAPLPNPPNYIDRVNTIFFWLGKNGGPNCAS